MKTKFKVGDRVICKAGYGNKDDGFGWWYKKGQKLTVNFTEKGYLGFKEIPAGIFELNFNACKTPDGKSHFSKLVKKKKRKEYIVSKQMLEAISSVPGTVGDEVVVVVVQE